MTNINFSVTSDLENLISQTKFERIFFLCGKKSYFLSGAYKTFKKILNKKETKFYFKSSPFPEIVELKKIIISLKKFSPDLIIAVGGGTVIDYAKIANFIDIEKNLEKKIINNSYTLKHKLAKLIAIPTTAGTGSEVGRSSVITIKETGKKTIFFHPGLMPDIAVLDPKLTVDLPPHISAATGMDAFTHCMEAYLVDSFHPMADSIAIEGMKMVVANLPKVMENPNNLEARGQMLLSATMGATAFQKGLGMIHSMAHPLSAKFNIHHGLANALLIKFCLEFTIDKAIKTENKTLQEKLNDIGNIISFSTLSDICYIPDIIGSFVHSIGIALGLSEQGIHTEHIAELGQLAFEDSCHVTHPFAVNQNDFHAVYTRAL